MKTTLEFTIEPLLSRKDGKISGPMSPFEFAKEMSEELGAKFNRLARVRFSDEEILQWLKEDGLTNHNHLIIAVQYTSDLLLSFWVDLGTGGLPVAICCMSDREMIITPVYQNASFAKKLTAEELTLLFEHVFADPHKLDIIEN